MGQAYCEYSIIFDLRLGRPGRKLFQDTPSPYMTVSMALSGGFCALIDDIDAERVLARKWYLQRGGHTCYGAAVQKGTPLLLHRFILGASRGQIVDHINGDGLDNRRDNLRLCSHAENLRNQRKRAGTSSRFKGVRKNKSGTWSADIEQSGKSLFLGTFDSEERAARQYDRAARVFFGKFAKTNQDLGLFDPVPDPLESPLSRI